VNRSLHGCTTVREGSGCCGAFGEVRRGCILLTVFLGMLLVGCGGSDSGALVKRVRASVGTENERSSSKVVAHSGALSVTLTARPMRTKVGSPVEFELTASGASSSAFGYQLRYGDGTNIGKSAVSLVCLEETQSSEPKTWWLSHRYKAAGRYRVAVSVFANCTRDRVWTAVTVIVD
jgi:hypothetical protein